MGQPYTPAGPEDLPPHRSVLTPAQHQLVETLFREHYPSLCAYAKAVGAPSRDDAEDLVQEAFWRVVAGHPCLTDPNPAVAVVRYLYSTIRGQLSNQRRKTSVDRRHRSENTAAVQALVGPTPLPTPDVVLETAELEARVRAAYRTLSKRQQQIYVLKQQGYTHVQIGARLGVSVNTVTTQWRRAVKRLHRTLGDLFPDLEADT